MRHRIIEIHQEIFNHNEHEVSKRWTFEEAVSGVCGRQHEQLLWEQGWQFLPYTVGGFEQRLKVGTVSLSAVSLVKRHLLM